MDKENAEVGTLIADRLTFFRHGLLALLRDRRPAGSLAEAGSYAELLDAFTAAMQSWRWLIAASGHGPDGWGAAAA